MPRNPIALFRSPISSGSIDAENGIVNGVHVFELGKLATFAGPDGKPKTCTITAAHIQALLGFAGNRAIPVHLSHDWIEKDQDGINSQVARLKNHRLDNAGNLVADLHLSPSDFRATALWNAQNDPDAMMLSAVFNYAKDDPACLPVNYQAADLVEKGAGVTALFAEANQSNTMDIQELLSALSDPAVLDALKAIIKSVESNTDDAADASTATAMESDAGVTDADKKPEDEQKPALMRAFIRSNRAHARIIAAASVNETALLAKAKTQAEAAVTEVIGKNKFLAQATSETAGTATAKFNAAVKELMDKGVKESAATLAVMDKQPELYREANAALFRAA